MKMRIPPDIFAYTIGSIILLILTFQIMKRTGLIRTREQRKTKKAIDKASRDVELVEVALNDSDYFNPNLWMKISPSKLLPESKAKILAKDIYDGFGEWWTGGDNEDKIYSAFNKLTNRYQVSQVSYFFSELYSADLLAKLLDKFDKSELYNIYMIIKKLPS